MSHLTKVMLKVLGKRIKPKIETELNVSQFGFRSDCGTRNAVFVLKTMGQRSIEMKTNIYMCFLDYTKAFDRIEHNKMLHFLDDLSLDAKDLRLIQTLYYQQYAAIRVNSKLSEMIPIKRGVPQGCILSPDLFPLYSEIIIRYLDDLKGESDRGYNISNLRYADDTVLLAHTEEDLQALLNELDIRSKHFGMGINSTKTEEIIVTKKVYSDVPQRYLNGKNMKQVEDFKYLGCMLSWNCRGDKEMIIRLRQAKSAFKNMKSILCNKNLSFKSRFRVLNCYIYQIFTFCSETWNISKAMGSRIYGTDQKSRAKVK